MFIWTKRYIIAFAVSFLVTYLTTPLVRAAAERLGILAYPGKGRLHKTPTALLGGVAIYLGYVLAAMFTFYYTDAFKTIVELGLLVLVLGAIDDIKKVPAVIKLAVLIGLAVLLSAQGVILHVVPYGFPFRYYINLTISILWIAGVISAFNAIDNMDGLASGIAAISSFMFFLVSIQTGQWFFGLLACGIVGSSLGFLPHNFKPAKIFLGNGGSLFLGFTLAVLAVMGDWSKDPVVAMAIPVLILAIPIIDIIFVVLWRHANKITDGIVDSIEYCGTDHISHRLEGLGFTQKRVVILLYLLSAIVGIGAIVLREAQDTGNSVLLLIQLLMLLAILGILLNIEKGKLKKFFYPAKWLDRKRHD